MLSAEAIEALAIQPGDRILLLPCGAGETARQLAPLVPLGVVVGMDPDDDQVRAARAASREIDNVMYVTAGVEEVPWKQDYFSHVILGSSPPAMTEVNRILVHGGKAFLLQTGQVFLLGSKAQ